jgi:hypothetical protein
MKYNPPYGVTDPNAPYINGDPSVGRAGSIPPAESIEYPQREIVSVIADIALSSPNNNDLAQMSAAVRYMRPQYVSDAGAPNHLSVTLDPAPAAWAKPLTFFVQMGAGNGNTSATVDVAIAGLTGAKSLIKRSGAPLQIGDLVPGCAYLLTYDGVNCRVVSGVASDLNVLPPPTGGGVIDVCVGNRDYYVNPASGNDSNDGKTLATAWRTLQYAYNFVQRNIDFAGYGVTFHCADGTYATGLVAVGICRGQAGNAAITFQGNNAAPANCLISLASGNCIAAVSAAKMSINGFKVQISGNYSTGVMADGAGSALTLGPMDYGNCGPQGAGNACNQLVAGDGAHIDCVANYSISGGAGAHMIGTANGSVNCIGLTIFINGNPYFQYGFVNAQENGTVFLNDVLNHVNTYVGTTQGPRYTVYSNGVIFVNGQGANYLPGNIGGSQAYGGQYF